MKLRFALSLLMVIVCFLASILWVPVAFPYPVKAAEPMPLCDPIGMGGGRIVYRCIDEDEGKIIYLNDLGFMFALDW